MWKSGETVVINKLVISIFPDDYRNKQCKFWNNPLEGFTSNV